jgi:S-adenosylmethionine synthetase
VHIDTKGSATAPEQQIETAVPEIFPLTPQGIIEHLQLRRPIFHKTAWGGHFGRSDPDFTWEATDKAEALRQAVGVEAEAAQPV